MPSAGVAQQLKMRRIINMDQKRGIATGGFRGVILGKSQPAKSRNLSRLKKNYPVLVYPVIVPV